MLPVVIMLKCLYVATYTLHVSTLHYSVPFQKVTDFNEICEEIERETERVTGNNKVHNFKLVIQMASMLFNYYQWYYFMLFLIMKGKVLLLKFLS